MRQTLFFCAVFLFVQNINCKIQISCKGYPKDIRQKQKSCRLIRSVKIQKHYQDYNPQRKQPDEREQISAAVEKEYAPKKVENKVQRVNADGVAPHSR